MLIKYYKEYDYKLLKLIAEYRPYDELADFIRENSVWLSVGEFKEFYEMGLLDDKVELLQERVDHVDSEYGGFVGHDDVNFEEEYFGCDFYSK